MLEFHSTLAFIPHGHCYLWKPGLVRLHALSDGLIALAYFSIPLTLLYFVRQRRDLPYPWIFQLFGLFIVACGLTHVMEIWTLWHPTYWVAGGLKAFTALVSLTTASALIPVIPQALTLPSHSELEAAKAELEQQVYDRTQSLRQSEERLQLALAGSGDGLWDWNIATGEAYLSPRWQEMLGYEAGELANHISTWQTLIHPEDRPWLMERLEKHLQNPQIPYGFDYRLQTKSGEWKWVGTYGKVVAYDDQGRPVRMAGTHKDISDRKRHEAERKAAEEAMQESNTRFRNLAANVPGAIFRYMLRPDGSDKILYMSPGCYGLWEVEASVAEADATVLWQMAHPDDFPALYDSVLESARTVQPWSWSWRITTPSKRQKWLEASGRPERQANGDVIWDTVILDITDRKTAEMALAESQQQYQNLVENSPDIIERFDLQLRHLYVSPSLTQITGMTAEVFLGKTCRELGLDEVMVTQWEEAAAALLKTGKRQVIEFSSPTSEGMRSFEMAIAPEWSDPQTLKSILCISRDITARQQAEANRLQAEKLRLNLTLLETLLDNILAGYWDWDIPNHTNYWSPGLKRMFGYEDHELPNIPETWKSLIFAEDLPEALECIDRHVQSHGEVPFYCEVRYRHKNGSTIWVICVGQVIEWSASGQPLRMAGCHIDITKLKQAEAQLQESDSHLKLAQRIGKIGSWEFNLRTEQITWSDQVFRLFGYDPAAGTPSFSDLQQYIHPDDRRFHQQTLQTAIAKGQPYDIECRIYNTDGELLYIQDKGEPFWDATGQLTHLTGTVLDITERKQAEIALRQSEATNRALISAIPDLLIWINHDGTYLHILGGGKSIKLHKPLSEQMDVSVYTVLPYEMAKERMHYIQQALQTNELQVYEYQFNIQGDIRDEEARIVKCGDHQVLCMVRDITDRKRTEASLLHTTAQLEASNRELEAFAYSVSHDLRSPLRAIDGFSKALVEDYSDRLDAEGQDYFDRIRHNVQRMGMLIDDLLNLSRVSRSEMRYAEVNLSLLVQEQINELRAAEPDRQVEVVIAPEAIVSADLTLMRVVVSNLLGNAWKFTSHRSVARIEFGIIRRDEQFVYFVCDNGAGFDMTYASMLFGVFQRLHNTNEFPGTGIGLATVQRVIHRHGGQIWAEAAVEQGATLYFTLPSPLTMAKI
ncbi:MAG: PAS domain-containing protein [Oscillatoriophycideae cyanobacterium NC_groundwater_1537_Pr4_S-0.65um_50_18]|nr:PAS domain-containing protein [Oscillatoriophycideae cyanobacterium NC_groundwater_1537_Pr4_S-0.65um_50_18]